MRHVMRTAVLIGAVVALAACGGDGNDATGGAEGGGGSASLSMVENEFQPADLTVEAGSELSLSNDGEAPHNLTIEGTSIDEDVDAGQSTTVTMDLEPGEYTMFCEFHRQAGMEGTVTVS